MRRTTRSGGYAAAVVVAWGAGLVFAGRAAVPIGVAVLLALPLAAVVAVRLLSVPESPRDNGSTGIDHGEG